MLIDIITIFPQMFDSFLETSLIARGIKKKIISINIHNLRDVATDPHKSVDDRPYGGGPGMVLRVDIADKMIKKVLNQSKISRKKTKVILLTPQGKVFNQTISQELSAISRIIFVCGHYEGFDERIRDLVDLEISIGDYILTGGELPAMVMIDSIARNIKGFLGKESSISEESFSINIRNSSFLIRDSILEYPHYTRPIVYKGKKVPAVLSSGNHEEIQKWRLEQAVIKTKKNRPDLLNPKSNSK